MEERRETETKERESKREKERESEREADRDYFSSFICDGGHSLYGAVGGWVTSTVACRDLWPWLFMCTLHLEMRPLMGSMSLAVAAKSLAGV